jgi:hypothetical protein
MVEPDTVQSLVNSYNSAISTWEKQGPLKRLGQLGTAAEVPLIRLLVEETDRQCVYSILWTLARMRLRSPNSVDAVVHHLSRKDVHIRCAAACCLLHSSPKFKRHVPFIRKLLESENNEGARSLLQMLLDRYPKSTGPERGPSA